MPRQGRGMRPVSLRPPAFETKRMLPVPADLTLVTKASFALVTEHAQLVEQLVFAVLHADNLEVKLFKRRMNPSGASNRDGTVAECLTKYARHEVATGQSGTRGVHVRLFVFQVEM